MNHEKKFNPAMHHRKAMRLRGYDYSQQGMYFVTICTHNKQCIFGEIEDGLILYSVAGLIAANCWAKIPEHFPNVVLHDYVIMPNHVHGIIEIEREEDRKISVPTAFESDYNRFQHMVPKSVSAVVKGFKIGVTKQLRYQAEKPFNPEGDNPGKDDVNLIQPSIWQSRFHDHIIRNDEEYTLISNYIINNPKNWIQDKFHSTS
jgi:putative transposase